MRRLSNVFLTINAVFAFIFVFLFGVFSIVFFAGNVFNEAILEEGGEAASAAYKLGMNFAGGVFVFIAIMSLISGIVSLTAKNSRSKGTLIVAMVFSLLSCTEFGVAGGILGLIATSRNE